MIDKHPYANHDTHKVYRIENDNSDYHIGQEVPGLGTVESIQRVDIAEGFDRTCYTIVFDTYDIIYLFNPNKVIFENRRSNECNTDQWISSKWKR